VHLPGQHMVTFFNNDSLDAIIQRAQNEKITLIAWFEANRNPALAAVAGRYIYAQFPQSQNPDLQLTDHEIENNALQLENILL
ncbi:5993_t:CDS:2, partial [Racocetra persica]